jgi:hypothetical protein
MVSFSSSSLSTSGSGGMSAGGGSGGSLKMTALTHAPRVIGCVRVGVDVSGKLFNQYEFKTVIEFKQLILKEKQRFIRGFVSHLLSYALGRDLGPADSPALDEMTAKAMAGKDQFRAVLKSIAMSEPFLHKNMRDPKKQ